MMRKVKYGTTYIHYSLKRADRKSLAIEIHPDLSIKVISPLRTTVSEIEKRVLKRALWIRKQQIYFEQFLPRTPKREYISGESHYYLGRKYVLKVRKAADGNVKLKGGEMIVNTPQPHAASQVKQLLTNWYHAHAIKKFNDVLKDSLKKFRNYKVGKPPIQIRKMAKRWGSCASSGKVILNPEIIKAPSKCIEYVIIHELCHLVHHDHSKSFYRLQSSAMHDWERWKMKLEKILA